MTPQGTRLLLLIDADPAGRRLVGAIATRAGWRTIFAGDAETAIATLGTRDGMMLDAILLDPATPGADLADLIAELRARRPALPVLVQTVRGGSALAVAAMRAGATDFLAKPIAADRLLAALDAAVAPQPDELRPLSEKLAEPLGFAEIVGSAPEFRAALAIAAKAARARVPVLIEGESGSGKTTLAEAIHAASPRAKRSLIAVNCGALAASVHQSELFGHERGAFTGAFDRHVGKAQRADGGTLLLTAVDRLSADAQAELLRLIEDGEVRAMGARVARDVDVRVIATSPRALADEVARGAFREDLFCRLRTVHVELPPLSARIADIPELARHLLGRIARQPGMRQLGLTDEALTLLQRFQWPGNVRQLHNALFRAAIACEGDALTRADFPGVAGKTFAPRPWPKRPPLRAAPPTAGGVALYTADGNLRPLEEIEADVIRLAIGHYRGRMTEVARRLGIGRSTLYRKLAELGISDAA